jgi:Ca2+-binding RTX toxin-like protein
MDTISGSSGNDTLTGTSAAEAIFGGDGNDTLTGAGGNDEIYGGKGTDTASYSGAYSNYTITALYEGKNGALSGYSVASLSGTDGTDTVYSDVEYLKFSNGTYQLDSGTIVLPGGTSNADTITGSASAEKLYGYAGDDSISGGAGNDVIDGGDGTDTSVYTQTSSKFTLSLKSNGATLADSTSVEGSDQLTNIEKLKFSDKTVFIETQAHDSYAALPESLWHFFIVAFNAAPGVTYMNQLAEAYNYGMSVEQIVNVFTSKSQFTDVYPSSLSHNALATSLVDNIVKSSATSATKASAVSDIAAALDYGWSVGKVIYTVFGNLAAKSQSDVIWGNTAKQFANEITVAKYYTSSLNQSTSDLATLRHSIASVSESTDVSTDAVVAQLIGVSLLTN